ncbi:MAG: hypothetical protein HKM07_08230 [Chlamydiae bacterium]|nr:hypothetical protein [Chlamydiota bacterium]
MAEEEQKVKDLTSAIKKVESNFPLYHRSKAYCGLLSLGFEFADLISSPESKDLIFQNNLFERVRKIVQNFYLVRRECEEEEYNPFSWLSFPLVFRGREETPSSDPIRIANLHTTVRKIGEAERKSFWRGMYSCSCPKTSPELIDEFSACINYDLYPIQDDESVMMVEFGSGGCLPTIAIVSQLLRFKNFVLILIDLDYTDTIYSTYQLKKGKVCTERVVDMDLLNDSERAAWNFLEQYANLVKDGHTITVSICPSTEVFLHDYYLFPIEKVVKQFLVTVDPYSSYSFAHCFNRIASRMVESQIPASFYRLNATMQINEIDADRFRLSERQATQSYRLLSMV